MWLSRYFVMFALYSVLGWVYESTFCTIKEGKWENRGFLYGPIVPIYGVGATGITMVYDALQNYAGYSLNWWQVFLIGYLGSIVLEFGTSWVLEKLFHEFKLEFHPLLECSIYVYMWKGHPLAQKDVISMKELQEYPCLVFEQGKNNSFYFAEDFFRK